MKKLRIAIGLAILLGVWFALPARADNPVVTKTITFSRAAGGAITCVPATCTDNGSGNATDAAITTSLGSQGLYWRLNFYPIGAPGACAVEADSSADNSSWNTADVVASQTCTSSGFGPLNATPAAWNYVRIHLTNLSVSKGVTVIISGFITNPAKSGGGGGSPILSTVAALPGYGSGSNLISGDLTTWTAANVTVSSGVADPTGGTGAYGIVPTSGSAAHEAYTSAAFGSKGNYILTFKVQVSGGSTLAAQFYGQGSDYAAYFFDFLNRTITYGAGTNTNPAWMYPLPVVGGSQSTVGWWAISIVVKGATSFPSNNVVLCPGATSYSCTFNAAGTESLNIYSATVQYANPLASFVGQQYLVTDSQNAQDCLTGGATTDVYSLCTYNGYYYTPTPDNNVVTFAIAAATPAPNVLTTSSIQYSNSVQTNQLWYVGDSLTANGSLAYPAAVSTTVTFGQCAGVPCAIAAGSRSLATMLGMEMEAGGLCSQFAPMAQYNIAVLEFAAANNPSVGMGIIGQLVQWHNIAHQCGFKTVALTVTPCMSTGCNGNTAITMNTLAVNKFIRQYWWVFADAVADPAAAMPDTTNTCLYQADQIHWTVTSSGGGCGVSYGAGTVAALVSTAINSITSGASLKGVGAVSPVNSGAASTQSYLTASKITPYVVPRPGTPTVVPQSGAGADNYSYVVVALLSDGSHTAASAAGSTSTGYDNLALGGESNSVAWACSAGAVSYNVYRTVAGGATTSSTGLIANVAGCSYNDIGAAGDSSSAPTTNTTGLITPTLALADSPTGTLQPSVDVGSTDTTITVTSTTGFPSSGWLVLSYSASFSTIEIVEYTGITSTTFTGVLRGLCGTSGQAHAHTTYFAFVQEISCPILTKYPSKMVINFGGTNGSDILADLPGRSSNGQNGILGQNVTALGNNGAGGTILGLTIADVNSGGLYIRTGGALNLNDNNTHAVNVATGGGKYTIGVPCTSTASPAVCGTKILGYSVIAAGVTTVVVDSSAVTANSLIFLTEDESLGTLLSVTCDTTSGLTVGTLKVTARTATTSFTAGVDVAPASNPLCFVWEIHN